MNQAFAVGSFTGTEQTFLANATPSDAAVSVDSGYMVTNAGTIASDTTAGTAGTGTINIQSFSFNATTLAGTLSLFTQNIIQATQFIPAQTTISQPITVTINNGAPSCTLELLQ